MLLVAANKMTGFAIELSFSIRGIHYYSGCDGIQAIIQDINIQDESSEQIGQTEAIYHNLNVDFEKKCPITFQFEKMKRLRVDLYVLNSTTERIMGSYAQCHFDLSLVLARGGKLVLPIPNTRSLLEITAHVPQYYSQFLTLQFTGSHIHSKDDLPLALYYILSITTTNRTILLHKSEIIRDHKNPKWVIFSIPLYILNIYNDAPISIYCYNQIPNHPDEVIGHCSTTLTQLQRGVGQNSFMLLNLNGTRIDEKCCIDLKYMELSTGPTFFDILKNKTNIHLTEAIDLTASNGNPTLESSLHYIHPHRASPYLKTIVNITPPFMAYLPNPENPFIGALGFGANVNQSFSNCFLLNGRVDDHRVPGLVGLIDSYRTAILSVQPFAPTDFSEIVYYVSKFAKAESRRKVGIYFVLLILSDGGPANNQTMRKTIDSLVDASPHPISIIAVGIGEDRDISPMRNLEGLTLKHSDGRSLVRQNYTFLEASEIETSDALSMIPLQMIQYEQLKN
ncbi:unnamed protein product [Caenorhabditis angaria]|uniref:VWFA domain-containing protein n=1 Tax=Caenorhabditis angaria TaxID=860376 RepID=A0A9P1ISH7_9PELO|nr:unnamed protein product [Caenorhabditis angaria]